VANDRQLSDDELLAIVRSGQFEAVKEQLTEDELRRVRSVILQSRTQGPGTREESRRRLARLQTEEDPVTFGGSLIPGVEPTEVEQRVSREISERGAEIQESTGLPSFFAQDLAGVNIAAREGLQLAKSALVPPEIFGVPIREKTPAEEASPFTFMGGENRIAIERGQLARAFRQQEAEQERFELEQARSRGPSMLSAAPRLAESVKDSAQFVARALSPVPTQGAHEKAMLGEFGKAILGELRESFTETALEPGTQFSEDPAEFVTNVADLIGAGVALPKVAARIAQGTRVAARAADDGVKIQAALDFLDATENAVRGAPVAGARQIPAPLRSGPSVAEQAAQRLNVDALPRFFSEEREKVATWLLHADQGNPGLIDELADQLNIPRASAKREIRSHVTKTDPQGREWARDALARLRAIQRVKNADPGPAEKVVRSANRASDKADTGKQIEAAMDAVIDTAKGDPENLAAPTGDVLDDFARRMQQGATDMRTVPGVADDTVRDIEDTARRADQLKKQLMDDVAQPGNPAVDDLPADPIPDEIAKGNPQSGFTRTGVAAKIAASSIGGLSGGRLFADTDEGKNFSIGGALFGATMGALLSSRRLTSGDVNFEQFVDLVAHTLPDRAMTIQEVMTSRPGRIGTRIAAGGIGGLVGGNRPDVAGFDPVGAAIGVGAGLFLGGTAKGIFQGNRAAQIGFNPRRALQRLLKQDGTLSPRDAAIKRKIMDQESGLLAEIRDTAERMAGATQDERNLIENYLRGTGSIQQVPERFRDAAATERWLFDEMAVRMVETGLAQGDFAKMLLDNRGTYLPRLFLQFEDQSAIIKAGSYFRQRGWDLRLIRDPDFFKKKKADMPKEVREALGEISAEFGRADPADDLVKAIKKGTIRTGPGSEWRRLKVQDPLRARQQTDALAKGGKIYVKMPNDKRLFGKVAGKFVDQDVGMEFFTANEIPESAANALFTLGTQFFKRSKVTWNPATLLRNIYGQIPLNDLAGVKPWEILTKRTRSSWWTGKRDYFGRTKRWTEAKRSGLFGGEWRAAELSDVAEAIANGKGGMVQRMAQAATDFTRKTNGILDLRTYARKMERFHEGTEQYMKMVVYNHARDVMGLDPAAAVRHAKRFVFDYREVPRWIQIVRKSPFGAPFISFSYKALPRVAEAALAVRNPRQFMAFWKYPMGMAFFNELSARSDFEIPFTDKKFGLGLVQGKDLGAIPTLKRVALKGLGLGIGNGKLGDDHTYQRFLSDYVGDQQVLLPFRDTFGRQQFLDLTWILPWGDLGEVGKGNIGKFLSQAGIPFPRQLEPSNPWLQAIVGGLTGRDAFTGREIVSPSRRTPVDALADTGRWLMRNFSPSLTPFAGFSFEKMRAAGVFGGGPKVATRSDVPSILTAIFSELLGLKTRPLDPRTGAKFQIESLEDEKFALQREHDAKKRRGFPKEVLDDIDAQVKAKKREISEARRLLRKLPKTPKKLKEAERRQRLGR
jgi:hypothetical protein